jgi:hypothetical protein
MPKKDSAMRRQGAIRGSLYTNFTTIYHKRNHFPDAEQAAGRLDGILQTVG